MWSYGLSPQTHQRRWIFPASFSVIMIKNMKITNLKEYKNKMWYYIPILKLFFKVLSTNFCVELAFE